MKPIGMVIPTRWEAAPTLKKFEFKRADGFYRGRVGERDVWISISGVGAEPAR